MCHTAAPATEHWTGPFPPPSPLQQIRANLSSPYGHLGSGTDIIVPWKIAFLLRTAWQIGAGLKEVFKQDRGPFRLARHFLALVPEYVLYFMYHVPVMRPHPRHWRSSTYCRRREYTYRVYPTRDIPSRALTGETPQTSLITKKKKKERKKGSLDEKRRC